MPSPNAAGVMNPSMELEPTIGLAAPMSVAAAQADTVAVAGLLARRRSPAPSRQGVDAPSPPCRLSHEAGSFFDLPAQREEIIQRGTIKPLLVFFPSLPLCHVDPCLTSQPAGPHVSGPAFLLLAKVL